MDHVFLSGNQRSGKTLLPLILASHPEITTRTIDEWRTHLSREEVATVESLVGSEREQSGCERTLPAPTGLSLARYRALRARDYFAWRTSWASKRRKMG
jgi:hypothetical protein